MGHNMGERREECREATGAEHNGLSDLGGIRFMLGT